MAVKQWLQNTFIDRRRSTLIGYPPKDKHIWRSGSFPASEHFNGSNFGPLDGFNERQGNQDRCAGRVLRPDQQVTWESGEGGIPKDGDVKEFQTSVSGAVGEVLYYMDPSWSEVNESGDIATIDTATGLITLEEGVCQGPYPPWIIYWVCDACGCSSGTIWLEDSSGDCLDCDACDCDSSPADDCVASCCITEDGTPFQAFREVPKQYTCAGGGTWSLSGPGVNGSTIDSTGLFTPSSTACGTITIENSVCQNVQVRIVDVGAGEWSLVSSETGIIDKASGCQFGGIDNCVISGSGAQDCVTGVLRYEGTRRQTFFNGDPPCDTCALCEWDYTGPSYPSCWSTAGKNANHCFWYVNGLNIWEWVCIP